MAESNSIQNFFKTYVGENIPAFTVIYYSNINSLFILLGFYIIKYYYNKNSMDDKVKKAMKINEDPKIESFILYDNGKIEVKNLKPKEYKELLKNKSC